MKRSGRKSVSQTPAPKEDRIYGSSKNAKGTASSSKSAISITFTDDIIKGLKNKMDEYNKKHPNSKVKLSTLKAVFRRGAGAYSKTHRPTISGGVPNSRNAWAYARVNKFLLKKGGTKVKAAYVQDDDLMEKGGETYHLGGDMSKHLAPNGKPSNLTHEQWHLVRTPGFKAWFGDWERLALLKIKDSGIDDVTLSNIAKDISKVVDENGEPLVVYRGDIGKFDVFEPNKHQYGKIWFSDNYEVAKTYTLDPLYAQDNKSVYKGIVKAFFLNIKDLRKNTSVKISERNKNVGILVTNQYDPLYDLSEGKIDLIGNNYVAFHSNQIKLADGSNTTFDANNPDIRYDQGGLIDAIKVGMGNPDENGIVLKDKGETTTLIVFNTKDEPYNKSLIYKSIKPIKAANEILQKLDNQEFETFSEDKIEEYKKNHLIILNQREVLYDSENLDTIRYAKGGKINDMLKKPHTTREISKKHKVPLRDILKQLTKGVKVEKDEHGGEAKKIALHHLWESPNYYDRLSKMEMEIEAKDLEGYYENGGLMESTCEVLDENGDRKIDKKSIAELTECVMNLPQTKSFHYDFEKNDYKPYRKRLHKDIIYKFKKDLVCIERDEPIAILMGGSPASGKSTFLRKYAPYLLKDEILKIDADEIRAMLPEYRGYNAAQTHLETKDIVTTLLSDRNIGIPCRFDVIYDGTMNNTKSYAPLIDTLKSLGYKIFIVYIDKVPKDVVVNRALKRYQNSGRFVPLEVIDDFFSKGKSALNELKSMVDGYMIIDGSDTNYHILETGGDELPQDRSYKKIGSPIKVTTQDVVRELKRGGSLEDENGAKKYFGHMAGKAGGLLVGNRHSEGGIKAINKSNGQPLEMEGGEVVITRNAVSDGKKREFEGEMLTNREILSRINESGGGVSFEEGGEIHKCNCKGKEYKYGGKTMSDFDIVKSINSLGNSMKIPSLHGFINKMESINIFKDGYESLYVPLRLSHDVIFYRDGDIELDSLSKTQAYKNYLKKQFNLDFDKLDAKSKNALLLSNQNIIKN